MKLLTNAQFEKLTRNFRTFIPILINVKINVNICSIKIAKNFYCRDKRNSNIVYSKCDTSSLK